MIGPKAEGARSSAAPGFADAVTFAFGDLTSARFGYARLGVAPEDAFRAAFAHAQARDGTHPLFELERGAITEAEYLDRLEPSLETGQTIAELDALLAR